MEQADDTLGITTAGRDNGLAGPSRFEIFLERNGNDLELDLQGAFDQRAARQLIEVLQGVAGHHTAVFIRTGGLQIADPACCGTFRRSLRKLGDLCYRLVFSGEHADLLALHGITSY
ncbi:MAG: hypothetical protein AB1640_10980 [bacterium]